VRVVWGAWKAAGERVSNQFTLARTLARHRDQMRREAEKDKRMSDMELIKHLHRLTESVLYAMQEADRITAVSGWQFILRSLEEIRTECLRHERARSTQPD